MKSGCVIVDKIKLSIGGFRIDAHVESPCFLPTYYIPFTCNSDNDFKFVLTDDTSNVDCNIVGCISEFENGFTPYAVYLTEDGFLWYINFKRDNQVIFHISKDYRTWTIVDNKTDALQEIRKIFNCAVLPYGGIVFHGVILEWKGIGIILSAQSGGGKTTHARLWRDNENALIINGDRALMRKEDGIWNAYGQPWCGTSGEYINRKIPISAFVMIKKSLINEVHELTPYEGALRLLERAFAPSWSRELLNHAVDHIDDIIKSIPVFELECRPDKDAVETLKKLVLTL